MLQTRGKAGASGKDSWLPTSHVSSRKSLYFDLLSPFSWQSLLKTQKVGFLPDSLWSERMVCGPCLCGRQCLEKDLEAVEKGKNMPLLAIPVEVGKLWGYRKCWGSISSNLKIMRIQPRGGEHIIWSLDSVFWWKRILGSSQKCVWHNEMNKEVSH